MDELLSTAALQERVRFRPKREPLFLGNIHLHFPHQIAQQSELQGVSLHGSGGQTRSQVLHYTSTLGELFVVNRSSSLMGFNQLPILFVALSLILLPS